MDNEQPGKRDIVYPPIERISYEFLIRLAKTIQEGDQKYGRDNWKNFDLQKIDDIPRHIAAHALKFADGDRSEDHLAHIACNAMMAMWWDSNEKPVPAPPKIINSIYFAHPIDATPNLSDALSFGAQMAHIVKQLINAFGSVVYDPASAFNVAPPNRGGIDDAKSEFIHASNRGALVASDIVVAFIPDAVSTVGTVYEVLEAHRTGKPVYVISGTDYVQLRSLKIPRFKDVESLINYVSNA